MIITKHFYQLRSFLAIFRCFFCYFGHFRLSVTPAEYVWWLIFYTTTLETISDQYKAFLVTSYYIQPFLVIFQPFFGYFWPFLATCDPFWWPWPLHPLLMTISFHYWLFLASSEHFQPLSTTSSHFCPFLAIFSYFWPFSATCGPFWPLPTNWCISDDHFLPLLTISDHFKAFWATSNHIQSFLAIFSYFWPFLATCDPLRPLPSTSNHF